LETLGKETENPRKFHIGKARSQLYGNTGSLACKKIRELDTIRFSTAAMLTYFKAIR
jgi:hypothetical protein